MVGYTLLEPTLEVRSYF